jgi:hypothetical protein
MQPFHHSLRRSGALLCRWFSDLFDSQVTLRRSAIGRRPRSARLGLERLEVREVLSGAPTQTLLSAVGPAIYSEAQTFTATVKSLNSGVPTGSVTFYDGSTALSTVTLIQGRQNSQASFTASTLAVGNHSITAVYNGNPIFATSNSNALNETVQQLTTTTLGANSNPAVAGQNVTFTATVTGNAPGTTPTGTVTFYDGDTSLGSAPLDSYGDAIFTTSALLVGGDSITADYGGDSLSLTSESSALAETVQQASSSLTLSADINPSVFGQAVTFTATLSAVAPGSGVPTGNVTFADGSTSLATVALNSQGQATFTISTLSVGAHNIQANYEGDSNFTGSSNSLSQTVNKGSTAVSLTSAANPSTVGDSVTFTATVSAVAPASGAPTGTVTFTDATDPSNPVTLGTAPLGSNGQATFATSALVVGNHTIEATYSGDSVFLGSNAPALNQVVQTAASTTTISSNSNPVTFGVSVTFTATVTGKPGIAAPTGMVTFKDGNTILATKTLGNNGQATFVTDSLTAGAHTITANYGGDNNYPGSSGSLAQTVQKDSTSVILVSNNNPANQGETVTFTASVRANAPFSEQTPTGVVTFYDNGVLVATIAVDGNGQASFDYTAQAVGARTITATYGGDGNFTTSTSAPLTETVNPAPQGLHWVGYLNNDMSVAGNYLEAVAPVAGDTIIFDTPPPGRTSVDASATPNLVASLGGIKIYHGFSGTVFIDEGLNVNNLVISNPGNTVATLTVDAGFTLTVNGATLHGGDVGGNGTVSLVGGIATVAAASTESALEFRIDANSQLVIDANLTLTTTTVTNNGTINWVAGDITLTGATIDNTNQFNISAARQSMTDGGGGLLLNTGQLLVSLAAPLAVTIAPPVQHNAGTMQVQAGTLALDGAVTSSANLEVDAGGALTIDAGFTANAGTAFSGTGTLTVSGPASNLINAAGGATLQIPENLNLENCTLSGPGDFEVTGPLTTITDGLTLAGTVVQLDNTTNWVSGLITLNGAGIQNQGTFNILTSGTIANGGGFLDNQASGSVIMGGGATTTIDVPVIIAGNISLNGLTLHFANTVTQTAGMVDLGGGRLDLQQTGGANGTYQLTGGTLKKNGGTVINGAINNTGGNELP